MRAHAHTHTHTHCHTHTHRERERDVCSNDYFQRTNVHTCKKALTTQTQIACAYDSCHLERTYVYIIMSVHMFMDGQAPEASQATASIMAPQLHHTKYIHTYPSA
jgi:hypothetical protein